MSSPRPPAPIAGGHRQRASTSAANAAATPENLQAMEALRSLLDDVSKRLNPARPATDGASGGRSRSSSFPDGAAVAEGVRQVTAHLRASGGSSAPTPAQDDFRRLQGFERALEVLRSFSGFYDPGVRTRAEKEGLFGVLGAVLDLLDTAFAEHQGNRRYFRHRVGGGGSSSSDGGWVALEQSIASTGLGGSDADLTTNCRLFGKLLAFALGEPRIDELCQTVAAKLDPETEDDANEKEKDEKDEKDKDEKDDGNDEDGEPKADAKETRVVPPAKDVLASFQQQLQGVVTIRTRFRNVEIVRTAVGFWESLERRPDGVVNPASILVILILGRAIHVSASNLAAVHSTGVLSNFLRITFGDHSVLSGHERDMVATLCRNLMYLGVNKLADAQFLLRSRCPETSQFCLDMTATYNGPPFIQFDLSLHGHASIELPTLGRSFPPQSSNGYTFTAWIRVDRFDPSCHTTIFGVFDSTQTCFVLMYLERDTRNFILQTSVTSPRPSVRFKNFAFKDKQWYHIALVHRRPKTMTASKASLYVNGELVEQIKAAYPASPPLSDGSTESFASFTSSSNRTNPVQAFLGTPRDLSTQLGAGLVYSKWSFASAHLFEDVLSDDYLAVHYGIGPRYQGNFQDCLGSFQTYEASASLGLRNEFFHPGKDENSDILRAIRDKASTLVPEQRLLMSILPTAVFSADGSFMDTQLFRCLTRQAANNLVRLTYKTATTVVLNAALPSVNDAMLRASGVAVLTGSPVVGRLPYHFDDNLWRLAGFTPVALKLVERATSPEEVLRAVDMMFRCIRKSWRNSEAMERDNGYAILGLLLRAKLGYATPGAENVSVTRMVLTAEDRDRLAMQLLRLILDFVGYKHADPAESFIVNPMAYRILLIDFDTWRRSSPAAQELYYRQFVTFAEKSRYHQFNSRRLLRMRIIKRLLDALKAEPVLEDVVPYLVESLECLIKCNYSQEVHRSLALFITYTFHPTSGAGSSHPRTPKPQSATSRSTTPVPRATLNVGPPIGLGPPPKVLTRKQLGTRILELYANMLCEKGNVINIRKFARTVTNKWLLYLLAEDDPEIVTYGCKILARLLVTQGAGYTSKFASKTGGFYILAHRLKRWWDIPTLWPICFSMLFGYDVADINFDRSFELFSLLDIFGECKVVYPDALPVITAMMQNGLKDVMRHQEDPDSPSSTTPAPPENVSASTFKPGHRPRARSMELAKELQTRQTLLPDHVRVARDAAVLQTVIRFLADLHARSANFRDFALSSDYIRLLFSALYPAIVSADPVTPDTELNSRDSTLTFEGADVIIRPLGGGSAAISTRGRGGSGGGGDGGPPGVVRQNTSAVDGALRPPPGPGAVRGTPLRKASSFILLPSQKTTQPEEASPTGASQAHLTRAVTPRKTFTAQKNSNALVEGLLELVIIIFEDQVLARKEFPGFGLYLRVPPGFQEHQAYFESYVLLHTISHLGNTIQLNQKVLTEPRILTNVARFCMHVVEAVFEGWFMGGAEPTMDFIGHVLEYLQRSEIAALKSVRLCSQAVAMIRTCFLKLVLLRLSEMDEGKVTNEEGDALMAKLFYWQTVLLSCLGGEDNVDNMRLLWYQLYTKLVDKRETVRLAAANIWRITLVQKPDESAALFRQAMASDNQAAVASGFRRLTEVDNETFVEWVDAHRPSLDVLFLGGMSRAWEEFVTAENARTTETARQRLLRRKDRLRAWHAEQLERENVLLRHEMANSAWQKSIYFTEHFKHQRLAQDQQDDNAFLASTFEKMDRDLRRPGAVFAPDDGYPGATGPTRWKLDRTEGRNRMRVRLLPDHSRVHDEYQPKRRATESPAAPAAGSTLRVNTGFQQSGNTLRTPVLGSAELAASPAEQGTDGNMDGYSSEGGQGAVQQHPPEENAVSPEDDFELVDDPNEPNDGEEQFEDKNRKVMRRLEHGDQVQHVYNVSRIIGIDTCEGILIIGKEALYLMDNVFRNQDGEIINVWQAPREERDPFSQIIGGHNAGDKRQHRSEQESRSWRWHDVISISKRRYIFRDVAIEIFFTDGRSYLLTAMNSPLRDEIYAKLMAKAAHTVAANQLPNPEDAWRLESVKIFDEGPQTTVFGAKFGSIFNASPWNPIMRRWQRGEMSNFHYLMMVNTMAGRTFNDLTQYPVFPWVLADYTSEELDLDDPRSFRDLTRPMGAQTAGRQSDFKLRYRTLAEIGETPFHYGTHYSSAMIVCSYLIRLPPFVQSFILLQGGSFDHPDRLFHSIEGAWRSASRDNGSDVRELIPEFFYLPDFLTNINGYNFGERQGGAGRVDNVVLPPWAKGDPKIFVHRMREALESPYVSRNLHHWIDLIFGYKQRGEAAVENLNVFHHLSYHGAKDLDNITDPQERAITTGIIHNFGQTPHQVFSKPHPPREVIQSPIRRLDNAVFALARLPHPLLESHERVASLIYAPKLDRLLCASSFRMNLPPHYDKFLEWGYADNSVRFFFTDNRKPAGLFENLHIGQLSAVAFADSKTLITAGEDCVVSVYSLQTAPSRPVELLPRSSLFGHRSPVTSLAVAKSFGTFVSVSGADGVACLWDLNRLEFIRRLSTGPTASGGGGGLAGRRISIAKMNDTTGDILLCCGPNVLLFTLNGELILDQNVCGSNHGRRRPQPQGSKQDGAADAEEDGEDDDDDEDNIVHAATFYEGAGGTEWLENYLLFTGHHRGVVNVWRKTVSRQGRWVLEWLRRLDHVDPASESGANYDAAITCITALPQHLYTGDEDGRVFEWNMIQRDR